MQLLLAGRDPTSEINYFFHTQPILVGTSRLKGWTMIVVPGRRGENLTWTRKSKAGLCAMSFHDSCLTVK
jgi:hypothetical protein